MAREIVSGNLNTHGNAGQFETDRSTWGFGDSVSTVTRSSLQQTAGLYSAHAVKNKELTLTHVLNGGSFTAQPDKKYLAKAKVRTPIGAPIAADGVKLTFAPAGFTIFSSTIIDQIDKTVLEAKDAWVEIEIALHYTGLFQGTVLLYVHTDVPATENGQLFVDQFEIYEYVDVVDPVPECTLQIDEAATVVTNETAPGANDGSITVAITGGSGTIEYSKDDGTTWQTSNQFTGLASGSYNVKVREQSNTSCVDAAVFTINSTDPTFDFTLNVTHESVAGASDGAIEATVTGTGGPFQFSKDGGTTWQLSNIFSGLVPGTYYITVKNSDGTQQVTKSAVVNAGEVDIEKVWHSKNRIILEKLAASNWESLANYRLYNDVRVEDVAGSGVFSSKLKVDLHPDGVGKVVFYIAEAFRDVFAFTTPEVNETDIVRLTDRIKRFKNFSGSLQDQEVTPVSLTESLPSLVLWGGLSKEKFPVIDYFTSYLSTHNKFLTWSPLQKYVDRTQEDYLNFFVYGFYTSLKLRIKAYFDDATDQTSTVATITGVKRYELYQIPAGPTNSGATNVNAAKTLVKYELSLLDQADAVITEVRTYHVVRYKNPLTRHFMFLNSLGTFEVLRFTGQAIENTSFQREILQRFLPHNYDPLDGEFAANEVMSQKRNSYSSGFIKGALATQWHEYMEDFLLSPRIYLATDGQRLPVVITGGDLTREDQNHERYFRFEAKPAYDNVSFTPANVK
jgi:hypothetical protein